MERKIETGGGMGWGVGGCYTAMALSFCECRIYLMHHGFLTKRKERKRKAMIWAEMRRGESKLAKA